MFLNDFFKTEEYFLFKKIRHLKISCHNLKFSTVNEMQKKNSKIKNVQGYSLNFMNGRSSDVLWGEYYKINAVEIRFEIHPGTAHRINSKNVAAKLF